MYCYCFAFIVHLSVFVSYIFERCVYCIVSAIYWNNVAALLYVESSVHLCALLYVFRPGGHSSSSPAVILSDLGYYF